MKNEELEITIDRIVPNGFGLGFAEGLTVFVSLAAAGDKLRVRIREKKGKVAFAEIVEVIEPSPNRIEPKCEYFGRCGGCDFQQMNYPAQLAAKTAIIKDSLKRIGKLEFDCEIEMIASPKEFGYRSRAQWHAETRNERLGYYKRNSHSVIDVESCPILVEELQETLEHLRKNLTWTEFWAEYVEIETASSGDNVSIYSTELMEPTEQISFEAAGNRYFYNAESFFQGNPELIEILIEKATANASGTKALDLYCGVGLFSLPLAKKFESVTGIEADAKAIDFARQNAELAGIQNAKFSAEAVGEWLTENPARNVDFILLDPPRTGAEKEAIQGILKLKPPTISYVSCDPATLARDLRLLCEEAYVIESITALDLFPQTHHIETVVRLKIKS